MLNVIFDMYDYEALLSFSSSAEVSVHRCVVEDGGTTVQILLLPVPDSLLCSEKKCVKICK